MSSQGFSFPPPPPPPPATSQAPAHNPTQHGQNWDGHGGNGGGRGGGQRGRGRGQGNRGRGGNHAESGRATSYLPPTSFNYAQPMYGGYPQPLPTAPYMPPQPYHHGQTPAFQNPQNPPSFSHQPYPQSVASGNYQHYNTPTNLPTPYPPTPPTYMQGLPTPPHGHPPNTQPMMPPMSWQGAAPYMGAQPGQARGPRGPHAHGNQGQKPRPAQKRDHSSAFNKPQLVVPRTPAAPAVPSFGNPLPSKPPPAADSTANRKSKKRKRKHNQLGLTPHTEDHESSEEEPDEDEESKLAQSGSDAAPLQVSYKGKTSTLQTSADIAAWIAERKKKFPTQARVEEKKKALDEAKVAREATRQQKQKEQQEKRKEHIQKQNEHKTDPAPDATTNAQRREKIRRNLEREEKRIQKAMAETEAARLRMEALQKEALSLSADFDQDEDTGITPRPGHPALDPVIKTEPEPANAVPEPAIKTEPEDAIPEPVIQTEPETAVPAATIHTEPLGPIPEPAQSAVPASHTTEAQRDLGLLPESYNPEDTLETQQHTDHELDDIDLASDHEASDWTSSGASDLDSDSDSDSDDSPEQATSRRTGPERVPPPPREGKKTVCRYFARNGHCNRGEQCKFLHENDSERTSKAKAKPTEKKEKEPKRKGLYQALLDRQKTDDDRRAMEVIFWLGQNDMLAD